MKNKKLVSHALDFVSFFIEKTKSINNIRRIILFGSVVRDEASKESDIDLFIDVLKDIKYIEKEIKEIKQEYTASKRYKDYWELKNITNEINVTVGKLDEWKDLKNSIISNGMTLYGKFEETPEKGVHKTLFSWENIKPESKRVLLSKRLFGYKKEDKNYEGLIQKFKGERIGKGMIMVPSESSNIFMKVFRDMKISVNIRKVIEYR